MLDIPVGTGFSRWKLGATNVESRSDGRSVVPTALEPALHPHHRLKPARARQRRFAGFGATVGYVHDRILCRWALPTLKQSCALLADVNGAGVFGFSLIPEPC